jgi:hypothetical protein
VRDHPSGADRGRDAVATTSLADERAWTAGVELSLGSPRRSDCGSPRTGRSGADWRSRRPEPDRMIGSVGWGLVDAMPGWGQRFIYHPGEATRRTYYQPTSVTDWRVMKRRGDDVGVVLPPSFVLGRTARSTRRARVAYLRRLREEHPRQRVRTASASLRTGLSAGAGQPPGSAGDHRAGQADRASQEVWQPGNVVVVDAAVRRLRVVVEG